MNIDLMKKPSAIMIVLLRDIKLPITLTYLAKEVNITYAHLSKTITKFEKLKLITTNKIGRRRIISLTEYGKSIAKDLTSIDIKLKMIQ